MNDFHYLFARGGVQKVNKSDEEYRVCQKVIKLDEKDGGQPEREEGGLGLISKAKYDIIYIDGPRLSPSFVLPPFGNDAANAHKVPPQDA